MPSISIPLSRARDPKGMSSSFSPAPDTACDSTSRMDSEAASLFIFNVLRIWTPDPYTRTITWADDYIRYFMTQES